MENKQKVIELEIISPEGIILKDSIDEIVLPSINGEIAVLPGHAPIFTKLIGGELIVKKNNAETFITITGGFLEVTQNKVMVLADYAIGSQEIEAKKVQEAKQRAEEMLKQKKDLVVAEKELKKSILELKIADKIRKRRKPSI